MALHVDGGPVLSCSSMTQFKSPAMMVGVRSVPNNGIMSVLKKLSRARLFSAPAGA
jgi:hypothetical protein